MGWNHRVCRIPLPQGGYHYEVKEVFYKTGTKTKVPAMDEVDGWTENGATVAGDSLEDLEWTLKQMRRALKEPVLEFPSESDHTPEASTNGDGSGKQEVA